MARLPRLVLPGYPYHVTQRGNRRQPAFFGDDDYALYRDLLAEAADKARAEVWAYCLMPNHVHVILVPSDEDGLRRTFADAHRRYTGYINARHRWTGHLWQGRFGLYHEIGHALRARENISRSIEMSGMGHLADDGTRRMKSSECDIITNFETPLAKRLGEPVRLYHADRGSGVLSVLRPDEFSNGKKAK